jgi:hypothetical protein
MSNKVDVSEKIAQLDTLLEQMPAEIVQCVQAHGFHKLAAAVYGVSEIDERSVTALIGTKLATSQQEWRAITSGLRALQKLRG